MQPELEKYYDSRFTMMATPGWQDLMDDVEVMLSAYNRIDAAESFEEFHKRKGQVDILQWLLGLKQSSEQSYEELNDEASL